jgi:sugar phosphate isomerase/epimerase
VQAYISTGAFRFNELSEIITFSINHGIDHIELSSGIPYQPTLLDPVRETNQKQITYLIHNYFPPAENPFVLNLASLNGDIRKRSIDLCEAAISLTAELEAPFYSVHSGFTFDMQADFLGKPESQKGIPLNAHFPYEEAYDTFVENIVHLTGLAKSKGVRLLIENNVVSHIYAREYNRNTLLMATADEIVRLMADVDDPALGVLVDVGHVKVTATALGFRRERFVEALAPHIGAFHLSDNDGQTDQNLPFTEDTWFCPLLTDFPHVPVVIEAYNLTWRQIQEQFQVLDVLKA